MKKCERTCVNDGVTFTETTHTLLESWKEKRGRKGQRLYLKKQYQISPKSEEIQTSKFMQLIAHSSEFIQNDHPQDTLLVIKKKREFYKQQEKSKCSQKRNSLKNVSELFRRNLTGQERKGLYIQTYEKKSLPTKNTFSQEGCFS